MLKQAWLNEKFSPLVLMFEEETVSRIREAIAEAEDGIADAQEEEGYGGALTFLVHIRELEVERIKYMLRSYFRVRLRKLEKYGMFILQNPTVLMRLSLAEKAYVERYVDLCEHHHKASFLDGIPDKLRDLTTQDADTDMVPKPRLDTHVFCKVVEDIGTFQLDPESSVELEKGALYVLPYNPIKTLLAEQSIVLI